MYKGNPKLEIWSLLKAVQLLKNISGKYINTKLILNMAEIQSWEPISMKVSVLLADIFQSKLLPDKLCFVLVHGQSFVPV